MLPKLTKYESQIKAHPFVGVLVWALVFVVGLWGFINDMQGLLNFLYPYTNQIGVVVMVIGLILISHVLWVISSQDPKSALIKLDLTTPPRLCNIKITEPSEDSPVDFMHPVAGFIDPPGTWVQLVVLANNGLWHVQRREAYVNGHAWNGKCQFGKDEKDSAGKSYRIVAITGARKLPKGTQVETIPGGLTQSNQVNVHRS